MRFLNNSGDEMHPDVATRIHASMRLVYPGIHPPKKKKKKNNVSAWIDQPKFYSHYPRSHWDIDYSSSQS